jgi:hypothetical protein
MYLKDSKDYSKSSINKSDGKMPVQTYVPLPGDDETPTVKIEPSSGAGLPQLGFCARLCGRYNRSFLFALGL